MPDIATLRVSRQDDRDIKFRESIIILDGKQVANLKYGQDCELEVEAGRHVIQAWNRAFKSANIEFDLAAGQTASFSTGNLPNGCFAVLMLLQMAPPTVMLRRLDDASQPGLAANPK